MKYERRATGSVVIVQHEDSTVGEVGLGCINGVTVYGHEAPGWTRIVRNWRYMLQFVDKGAAPSLLPIFRSQQQAELLALVLGGPAIEFTLTELAERTAIPYPSVHREVERAQAAGLITSRNVGRTRVIRADTTSPYFAGLSDVLAKAFGVPWIVGQALDGIAGIENAYIYGSWAARFRGESGQRPVGDIDVLVLGEPDRDALYAALSGAEVRLGRPIQVSIRAPNWLVEGTGSFHDTVAGRPLVAIDLIRTGRSPADHSPAPDGHLRRHVSP